MIYMAYVNINWQKVGDMLYYIMSYYIIRCYLCGNGFYMDVPSHALVNVNAQKFSLIHLCDGKVITS